MDYKDQIPQISAEMYLERLYPELSKQWIMRARGTFFRNYTHDIIYVNPEKAQVVLSRNGYLKLLPQGLITPEIGSGRKKKETPRERKRRVELLNEAFVPFDTFTFKRRLDIERKTSELLEDKLQYILETYFHFNLQQESNEYVREAATLLPFISKMRADVTMVHDLLKTLVGCDVNIVRTRYSEIDDTRCWLPCIRFELLIDNLTHQQHIEQQKKITPLVNFIKEWFIPFDVHCDICIKQHGVKFTPDNAHTLEYNTYLTSEQQ